MCWLVPLTESLFGTVNGTTGEGLSLSVSERRQVAEAWVTDKREEQVSVCTGMNTLTCKSCTQCGSSQMRRPPCPVGTSQAQASLWQNEQGPEAPGTLARSRGRGALPVCVEGQPACKTRLPRRRWELPLTHLPGQSSQLRVLGLRG